MSRKLQIALVVFALCGAVFAFWDAWRDSRALEQELVLANVDSLRNTVLALEQTVGRVPTECGSREIAESAVASDDIEVRSSLGACGHYLGRELEPGPIWMEAAPGGVDFSVHGLANGPEGNVEIIATRAESASYKPSK
ncbi:MAG TPA: hypothetical protein QGF58_23120 [Myxococcota bacterium]|nr:hypothetical protein [Myxococcota bacterium]